MLGVRMQSWALWLAEALEVPYTCLARDGALATDAAAEQVPRLRGPYDIACVYVGVNDVRTPGWVPANFAQALERIVLAAAACSEQLLLVTLPAAIGRPPAPAQAIAQANGVIAREAGRAGALLVDAGAAQLGGDVLADRVHLTARGQARLAKVACRSLAPTGFAPEEREIDEALRALTVRGRLRYALGAGALDRLRDARRLLVEGAGRRLGVGR
jgi:hypothetical protein